MLEVLGQILPYAVPVALSPLPVIAGLMLLLGPPGPRGAMAFLAGRLVVLVLGALAAALLAETLQGRAGGDVTRVWLRLGLGLVLVVVALRGVLAPPAPETDLPGWLRALERASPSAALRLGALVTVANPKELAFLAGAGITIGSAGPGPGTALLLSVVFALLAGAGVGMPVILALLGGPPALARMAPARDWLVANRAVVMAAVLGMIAALLIGGALGAMGG